MAIFNPSAIVGAISGKLGGVVFVNGPAGRVIRHRPAGQGGLSQSHQTAAQQLVRVQREWRDLTTAQRESWRTFARDHPTHNRLGRTRPLSAFQAFVRFNLRYLQHKGFTRTTPAAVFSSLFPQSISLTASASGNILLDFDPTSIAPFYSPLVYGATRTRSTIPTSYHNWRYLGTFQTSGSAPGNLNSWWDPVWPHPVQGQDVAIRTDFYNPYFIFAASYTATALTTA